MNLFSKLFNINTKYTKENQQFMLRAVTSYSVFLLVILLMFLFVYRSSFNNIKSTYQQNQQSTLINDVELFEKDLNIMEVYARQLLQNSDFRSIALKDKNHPKFIYQGEAISNSLAVDVYPESLLPIKEVFCYLKTSDYVINPSYFITGERFYHWIQKFNAANYDEWTKLLYDSSNYKKYLPLNNFYVNSPEETYLYILNIDDLYYLKTNSLVCFIIEKKETSNLFSCLLDDTASSLLVIDSDGTVILKQGSLYENSILDDNDIIGKDYVNGFTNMTIHSNNIKHDLTVGKYISPNTGYQYFYSFPAFESTGQMASKSFTYLIIVSLVLLIGSWLVIILARRDVKPIIELGDKLEDAKVVQTQLQEVVDNQKPIIKRSYVRQIMLGMVSSEDEIAYMRRTLDYSPDENYVFNSLYVVAYNAENQVQTSDTISNEEFNKIILDSLHENFGEPFCYFRPADRTFGILLSCKESDENESMFQIHDSIVKIHNHLLDTYGIWLIAGVGKSTNDLMNIWEAYQQASEAASYISKNYFFFPYEFIKKDSSVFYYPPEISTKLIHFITTGNTAQVLELFNLIHQENIEERSLPVHILKFLLSDIRNTLLKARFALPENVDSDEVRVIDERFREHMTFKLCEDIALSLCNLFSTPSDESNLISAIEKYIQDNYMDASMGLNKIADEFQISETYFSHMFKEKTGVNFSTYLENKRMSEAARLIKETDISLNELYINVGYNNVTTFRRAFKKVYGVTPSAMRDNK